MSKRPKTKALTRAEQIERGLGRVKGKHGGGKKARALLNAGRILEIIAHADPGTAWTQITEEFGDPENPKTGKKWNIESLAKWAAETYMGEQAKEIGAARLVQRLESIAHADLADFIEWDQNGKIKLKGSVALTPNQRRAIGEVVEFDGSGVKVRPGQRLRAIELLRHVYGLGPERHEHTGKDGKPLFDYAKLSDNELDLFERLLAKLSHA